MENKTSTKRITQPAAKLLVTSRFIFGLAGVIFIALALAWFAIWQGIEFTEYKWTYSENYTVKAGQYLLHGLWGTFFATSPAWWLGGVALSAKMFLPKI